MSPLASATAGVLAAGVIAPSPFAALTYMMQGGSLALLMYGICLGLGLPTYALLLWKRWLSWWHYVLGGIAASASAALSFCIYLALNDSKSRSLQFFASLVADALLLASLHGALVALLAWPFVRRGSHVLASTVWPKNAA